MSLYIEFEPHSWYKGFAVRLDPNHNDPCVFRYDIDKKHCIVHGYSINPFYNNCEGFAPKWSAVTANGMTGYVDTLESDTLKDLKQRITDYRAK